MFSLDALSTEPLFNRILRLTCRKHPSMLGDSIVTVLVTEHVTTMCPYAHMTYYFLFGNFGRRLASKPEGPGSSPETTDFLTDSCRQATIVLVPCSPSGINRYQLCIASGLWVRRCVHQCHAVSLSYGLCCMHCTALKHVQMKIRNKSHYIKLHHPTSHHITLHHPTSHYITLHHPTPHYVTLHHITSHLIYIKLHYPISHYITLHHPTSNFITLHHITSHYIKLHHPTSHYITLHHITSHYITLHQIS